VTAALLEVSGLRLAFAGLVALDDVSFEVRRGEIFAVIGPNGAGKTSIFNCLCGVYRPQAGRLTFDGRDLRSLRRHEHAAAGIARTFQNVELFPRLTVVENLMLGRHHLMRTGLIAAALYFGPARAEEVAHRARVEQVVDFLELEAIRDQVVAEIWNGLEESTIDQGIMEHAQRVAVSGQMIGGPSITRATPSSSTSRPKAAPSSEPTTHRPTTAVTTSIP